MFSQTGAPQKGAPRPQNVGQQRDIFRTVRHSLAYGIYLQHDVVIITSALHRDE